MELVEAGVTGRDEKPGDFVRVLERQAVVEGPERVASGEFFRRFELSADTAVKRRFAVWQREAWKGYSSPRPLIEKGGFSPGVSV